MEGSDEEIQSHLKHFGDFVEVSDVDTRAKKIGFLFSPFRYFVKVNEDPREKPDSTDGSQFMSRELAAKARATMGVNHPEPSALLVHYQGFQGILVLGTEHVNTPLQDSSQESTQQFANPQEMSRPVSTLAGIVDYSRQDFQGISVLKKENVSTPSPQDQSHERTGQITNPQETSRPVSNLAYILDYSRPHVNAYLDAKLVMLLAARGVRVEYLKALQTDYYRLLENMCNDSASSDYFLRLTGRTVEGSQTHVDIGTLRREEVKNMVERNGSEIEDPRVRISSSVWCP